MIIPLRSILFYKRKQTAASLTLDFQAALEDFLRLCTANGDMSGDFLITANAERADGQPRLGEDRGLSSELFQNARCTRESIARFADTNVQNKLLNFQLPHRVGQVLFPATHLELRARTLCNGLASDSHAIEKCSCGK